MFSYIDSIIFFPKYLIDKSLWSIRMILSLSNEVILFLNLEIPLASMRAILWCNGALSSSPPNTYIVPYRSLLPTLSNLAQSPFLVHVFSMLEEFNRLTWNFFFGWGGALVVSNYCENRPVWVLWLEKYTS